MADQYNGALIDDRPTSLVEKDFRHEEVAPAAGAAGFREKKISEIAFYELRDQAGSSTCMNQSYAKLRGILTQKKAGKYVSLSGGFIYRRRQNQDSGGMYLHNTFELGKSVGLPFEVIDPSQKMGEAEILSVKEIPYADDVAKLFTDADEKFLYLPHDFDAIASVVEQGFPVLVMVYAQMQEYNVIPRVDIPNLTPVQAYVRHGITVVDTVRFNGVDYLVADDSAFHAHVDALTSFEQELKKRGQRLLSRQFVNTRVYGAGYIRELRFGFDGGATLPPPSIRPRHTFTKQLHFIAWGNNAPADPALHEAQKADVVALQEILKFEGLFDRSVASTGYYGNITARAVDAYQRKYSIAPLAELNSIKGRVVGPKTLAHLNANYSA